jgi:ankyrin repeat protein
MSQNSIREFMAAVRGRDHASAERLLAREPALACAHDPACFGATALGHAAGAGDRAMIDVLLAHGADPDQASDWWAGGFRPLDSADEETSEYLLSRGATLTAHAATRLGKLDDLRGMLDGDPSLVHARGGDGQFPLHFARTPEVAALLLERGAALDARDIDHASTAAQWAAVERPDVAHYLVGLGAAADLFMASAIGDEPLIGRLLEEDPEGVAARITAERFPAPGSQALGIYHYTIGSGCTALHAAAASGRAGAVGLLIARGADPNAAGGYDDGTPLHVAAWHDRVDAAAALLDGGAEIDRRSGHMHSNTPLGWAIVGGSAGVVGLLLSRGAAVLDFMAGDVERGAAGEFRQFKRAQGIEAWERVREAFAGR